MCNSPATRAADARIEPAVTVSWPAAFVLLGVEPLVVLLGLGFELTDPGVAVLPVQVNTPLMIPLSFSLLNEEQSKTADVCMLKPPRTSCRAGRVTLR